MSQDRFGTADSTPAFVGPLRVYRQWTWQAQPGSLRSAYAPAPWPDGVLSAECYSLRAGYGRCFCRAWPCEHHVPPHGAPLAGCKCGVWAYYRPDKRWVSSSAWGAPVWGSAVAWGRVIPGDWGVRAEHARCEALVVPMHLRDAVAAALPDVALYDDEAALLAAHPPADWASVVGPLPEPEDEPVLPVGQFARGGLVTMSHQQHVHMSSPSPNVAAVLRVLARALEVEQARQRPTQGQP